MRREVALPDLALGRSERTEASAVARTTLSFRLGSAAARAEGTAARPGSRRAATITTHRRAVLTIRPTARRAGSCAPRLDRVGRDRARRRLRGRLLSGFVGDLADDLRRVPGGDRERREVAGHDGVRADHAALAD